MPAPFKPTTLDSIPAPVKGQVLLNAHGRGPWYGMDGKVRGAYVIGIAGGSGSGKTTVAQSILTHLSHIPTILILSQDSFYLPLSPSDQARAHANDLDLDRPESIDVPELRRCVRGLKEGRGVRVPVYSFVEHQRMPESTYLYGANVIIVEGIMALHDPELRDLYDLKVFVNADSDVMLARRIRRDIAERGRDVEGVLTQYLRFVKASYDNYVLPSSRHADIIVPGASNAVAIDLIVTHIHKQLADRNMRFRDKLGGLGTGGWRVADGEEGKEMKKGKGKEREVDRAVDEASKKGFEDTKEWLFVLERTSQVEGILTILRNRDTPREEFIFYTDRLSALIVEKGISLLPYESSTITTPLNLPFSGQRIAAKEVVGVSIARSGGPFADGLRRVIKDVKLGSLLIQSEVETGEPLLFHTSLPECLKFPDQAGEVVVVLMDSQMGTGASALMAVRVLLDHGVRETNIIFLTFLAAKPGVHTLHRAFPGVRIVTAACEERLEEVAIPPSESRKSADAGPYVPDTPAKKVWAIVPDAGAIGDRYYGA